MDHRTIIWQAGYARALQAAGAGGEDVQTIHKKIASGSAPDCLIGHLQNGLAAERQIPDVRPGRRAPEDLADKRPSDSSTRHFSIHPRSLARHCPKGAMMDSQQSALTLRGVSYCPEGYPV